MKIYTKTGDKGTTRLVDGTCVDKSNPRVEAYGTVDELNSFLGLLRAEINLVADYKAQSAQWDLDLSEIQHRLFDIGSLFATENKEIVKKLKQLEERDIHFLERQIDILTASLPPLKNFILPAGHKAAALAHVCRTICRRAERQSSVFKNEDHYHQPLIYLNRLSDYLFTLARYLNWCAKVEDVIWKN